MNLHDITRDTKWYMYGRWVGANGHTLGPDGRYHIFEVTEDEPNIAHLTNPYYRWHPFYEALNRLRWPTRRPAPDERVRPICPTPTRSTQPHASTAWNPPPEHRVCPACRQELARRGAQAYGEYDARQLRLRQWNERHPDQQMAA